MKEITPQMSEQVSVTVYFDPQHSGQTVQVFQRGSFVIARLMQKIKAKSVAVSEWHYSTFVKAYDNLKEHGWLISPEKLDLPLGSPAELKLRQSVKQMETHREEYQQALFEYWLGTHWMRPAQPAWMTEQEAAQARVEVKHLLRRQFPEQFPQGYRFR